MAGLVQVVQQPFSTAEPTEKEQELNSKLMKLMTDEELLPGDEEEKLRVRALGKLNELVRDFIRRTLDRKGMNDQPADDSQYRLRTFGSYRLDVHLPGADMDTVVIVTKYIERRDMFEDLYVHFAARKDIKDLVKVEEARVPVIKFTMDNFEFDLAMACLPITSFPEDFDVTDDKVLRNVDQQSVTSLNGVRVTDTIMTLVPTMATLKFAIRAFKLWAKRRGVYKNVLGFLGGISLEIMAARIGQMYPKGLPCKLVSAFFLIYSQWNWPMPVGLTEINPDSCELSFPVWMCGPTEPGDRRHVMPIITPVYNATANVSKSTLKVMCEEFQRGREVCKRIEAGQAEWAELFEPLDVMSKYTNFLQVQIMAPNKEEYSMWKGFTEANLRNVVSLVERWPDAYLDRAHPCPRNFMKPRENDDAPFEHYWYIGLKFDLERLRNDGKKAPNIATPVRDFKTRLMSWQRKKDGMTLFVTSKKTKDLPKFVTNPEAFEETVDQNMHEIIQGEGQDSATTEAPATTAERAAAAAADATAPAAAHASSPEHEEAGGKRPLADAAEGEPEAKKIKTEPSDADPMKVETPAEGKSPEKVPEAKKEDKDTPEEPRRDFTAELMQAVTRGSDAADDDGQTRMPGARVEANARKQMFVLDKGQELRIEVETHAVSVTLETGHAEIFGAEMPKGETINLVKAKLAVYTWHGCTLSLRGEAKVVYVGETTPMTAYGNVHGFLQQRRQEARKFGGKGPRTMLVGPSHTGKSSLAKVLVNYAVRQGERPMLVDLDLKEGLFLVPGAIGAAVIDETITRYESQADTNPIAYYYGHRDVDARPELLKLQIGALAANVAARLACPADKEGGAAGVIIDAFACSSGGPSYDVLRHAAKVFEVDYVLVIEMDKLYTDLKRDLARDMEGGGVTVVRLNRSGGVVAPESAFRKHLEKQLVHDYMYGRARNLCPRPVVLPFSQVFIYQTLSAAQAPKDALPIGAAAASVEVEIVRVEPDASLENKLVGLCACKSVTAPLNEQQLQDLLRTEVAGFLHVRKVDMALGKVTFLAPNGLALPSNVMMVGEIDFVE